MNRCINRFRSLLVLLAAMVLPLAGTSAYAQAYPQRPVKLVVPTAVGGAVDTTARIVGKGLTERWKQAAVIENKPGAGGGIGAAQVAKSAADGYTLAFISTGYTALSSMYGNLTFDPVRDFVPVALVGAVPYALLVPTSSPYQTADDLVRAAKQQAGQLNFASGGNGTLTHLLAEWFRGEAGFDATHVPYAGAGPALQALLGGQASFYFDPISTSAELVKAGRLRALGTTGAVRSAQLPAVPTLTESGHRVQGAVWFGILAPAGTPAAIVEQLQGDVAAVLGDAQTRQALAASGIDVQPLYGAKFGEFLASETKLWGGLVKRQGIKAN